MSFMYDKMIRHSRIAAEHLERSLSKNKKTKHDIILDAVTENYATEYKKITMEFEDVLSKPFTQIRQVEIVPAFPIDDGRGAKDHLEGYLYSYKEYLLALTEKLSYDPELVGFTVNVEPFAGKGGKQWMIVVGW